MQKRRFISQNQLSAQSSEIQCFKPVFSVFKPVPVAVSASCRFLATVYHPELPAQIIASEILLP